jgi:hypothetical protein
MIPPPQVGRMASQMVGGWFWPPHLIIRVFLLLFGQRKWLDLTCFFFFFNQFLDNTNSIYGNVAVAYRFNVAGSQVFFYGNTSCVYKMSIDNTEIVNLITRQSTCTKNVFNPNF